MTLEKYTALYSPLDIEYSQAMSGLYEDLSFRSDECTVIAGLKDNRITGFWRPVVMFGDDKLQKEQIKRLYDICPNIYYQDFLINGLSPASKFLLERGYKATPYYTRIIDLTKSYEELHAGLRKSYKSLCNSNNIILSTVPVLREIHEQYRGRTRNDASWQVQQQMWDRAEATVVTNKQRTAGVMFYERWPTAYYACSASNAPTHQLIWKVLLELKRANYKSVEMGEQVWSGDSKLIGISKFKRGFGGRTVTRLNLRKEE